MQGNNSYRCQLLYALAVVVNAVVVDLSLDNGRLTTDHGQAQQLSGDHTWLVTPVPIPNTAVKQPGPMVVATAARVGHRRVYQTPAGASQRAFVFL